MKIAKAKALDQVDGLLRKRWRVNERHAMEHVAVRAPRVSANKLNSKLVSELEKGWCNCALQLRWQVSHHTHHTVEALEKKAQGSQRCPRREVEV